MGVQGGVRRLWGGEPARYVPRSGFRLEFPQFKPLRSEDLKTVGLTFFGAILPTRHLP